MTSDRILLRSAYRTGFHAGHGGADEDDLPALLAAVKEEYQAGFTAGSESAPEPVKRQRQQRREWQDYGPQSGRPLPSVQMGDGEGA
jgi:hypothetical protein